jgi:hypothetical protein
MSFALKFSAVTLLGVFAVAIAVIAGGPSSEGMNSGSDEKPQDDGGRARICGGFDFSGKIAAGYLAQHGGTKVKVRIPADYLLFPETVDAFSKDGNGAANFNFHRDTLKPYPRRDMQGKIVAGREEWVSFLVTNFIEINELARVTANVLSGRKAASGEPSFTEQAVSEGLFQVQLPVRWQPDWQKQTLFFGREGSSITDVISCTVPQPRRYPHCEQITRLGGYDVKIGYPLDQLKNWKLMKGNIQSLLNCMTN